jgi:proline dehydrogenase
LNTSETSDFVAVPIPDKPFENTTVAFSLKSDAQLRKSYYLFKMMGNNKLVDIGSGLTNWALKIGLPIKTLVKKTVFEQFCGGTTEEKCMPLVERMFEKGVSSILDYSVEGKVNEAEFDKVVEKKLRLIDFASYHNALPFEVVKPTGLGRFDIWHKVSENKPLSPSERAEWERIEGRVDLLCKTASEKKVMLLFDAEETWMQDAADELIRNMMAIYNKEEAIVYNTIQCYRKDRFEYIQELHEDAVNNDFIIGAKIVRGAYMEKERERAAEMAYDSPICNTKQDTDDMFNKVMYYCLDRLESIRLCVGTHNEESTLRAMKELHHKNIAPTDTRVWFGQLYGMSDNLSFNLAALGYNSFKILPFGPVKDVMPYLIRRAQENTSVAGQMGRELALVKKEMQRRGLS